MEPKVDLDKPEGIFKLAEFYASRIASKRRSPNTKLSATAPVQRLAIEAELKVADCHFKRSYAEAASLPYV